VSAQTIWTWVDDNGRRHYSDTEMPGAVQVDLAETQTFSGSALTLGRPSGVSTTRGTPAQAPVTRYSEFRILSPEPEETLRNIEGEIVLQLATTPPLNGGHRIDVIVDGSRRNLNVSSQSVRLPEIYRGEHTVQAVIIDAAGTVIQRSGPVTFFVQQTSVITSPAMQGRGAPPAGNGTAGSQ
jgi:hypothetical protein